MDSSVVIDLSTGTTTVERSSVAVAVVQSDPELSYALPGPTGPPGLLVVHHGTATDLERPSVPWVLWLGTATPSNALPWDVWEASNI